jgi:hypothetical protein
MMKGMDLALKAQARLYIVLDEGEYHGFVLLGLAFKLYVQGEWYDPLKADALQAVLRSFISHESALQKICDKLSVMQIKGSEDVEEVDPKSLTPRKLFHECERRDVSKELASLMKLFDHLSFTQSYWRVTGEHIKDSIYSFFSNADLLADNPWPLYVCGKGLEMSNRSYFILGAFGPTAPSFINGSAREVSIPAIDEEDKPSILDPVTKRRSVNEICLPNKELFTAIKDWEKMLEKGVVQMNDQQISKQSRGAVFTGKDRDGIWRVLRETVGNNAKAVRLAGAPPPVVAAQKKTIGLDVVSARDFY